MLGLTRRNGETMLARPQRAELGRWDPWNEFNRIQSEMGRLFEGFLVPTPRLMEGFRTFAPPVDLYETADEVVFNAYLPGMSREDIHIEATSDAVHLWGESKPNIPQQDVTVHFAQGGFGQFDFRYRLPVEVKADECKATYRSGVLELRLAKTEWAKPKPVEVQIEG